MACHFSSPHFFMGPSLRTRFEKSLSVLALTFLVFSNIPPIGIFEPLREIAEIKTAEASSLPYERFFGKGIYQLTDLAREHIKTHGIPGYDSINKFKHPAWNDPANLKICNVLGYRQADSFYFHAFSSCQNDEVFYYNPSTDTWSSQPACNVGFANKQLRCFDPLPDCSNNLDDDHDNLIDAADPGCSGPNDDDERDEPQCKDLIDNDRDNHSDCADPGCHTDDNAANNASCNPNDPNETNTPRCGNGVVDQGSEQCDDGNASNTDGCSTSCQLDRADLSITKTGPSTVVRGGQATYRIVVTNVGSSPAQNIIMRDTIQGAGLTLNTSASSAFCSQNGSVVTCTHPNLIGQSSKVFTLVFEVASSASCSVSSVNDTATVSSDTADTNQSNNTTQPVVTTFIECASCINSGRGIVGSWFATNSNVSSNPQPNVLLQQLLPGEKYFLKKIQFDENCTANNADFD